MTAKQVQAFKFSDMNTWPVMSPEEQVASNARVEANWERIIDACNRFDAEKAERIQSANLERTALS